MSVADLGAAKVDLCAYNHKKEVRSKLMTNQTPNLTFSVAGHQVGTKQETKCLRYWLKSNLEADACKSVEANLNREGKPVLLLALYWCLSRSSKLPQFDGPFERGRTRPKSDTPL